jgi:adenylate cyclase
LSIIGEFKRRNVLRVAAAYLAGGWLLIQLVNEIFPLYGFSDAAGRIAVTVIAIGFVPALVVAWVFELTPDGLRLDTGAEISTAKSSQSTRLLDRAIMIVLACAVALFGIDRFVFDPSRDASRIEAAAEQGRAEGRLDLFGDTSIAVLAFDDVSLDGGNEYLSEGIAETVLDLLDAIPELRVVARSSTFAFKGTNTPITAIAERLNVEYVLTGSVQLVGDRLRVRVRLVDGRTDTQIWSRPYDRTMDDVFAIQDEIAAQVVDELSVRMLGEMPHADRTRVDVLNLFYRARHVNNTVVEESFDEAAAWLEQAIELDSDYYPAWNLLMQVYNNMVPLGVLSVDESLQRMVETIERGEEIFPDGFYRWRAWIAFTRHDDLEQAARWFELDRAADPDFEPNFVFAAALNRHDIAIELARNDLARDPINVPTLIQLFQSYLAAGRYEELEAHYDEVRAVGLDHPALGAAYGDSLLLRGESARALEVFESLPGGGLAGKTMALHSLGRMDEFQAAFAELKRTVGDRHRAVVSVYAYIGDLDAAFEILIESPKLPASYFDGPMAVMKNHERWNELAIKAGLYPTDPRERIEFDFGLL